jgi:archaeosine synthase beta-subunit
MSTVNPLLRKANVAVRRERPPERPDWEYGVRKVPVALQVQPRRMAELTFIYFRSFGCRFDRAGECSMCNYAVAEQVTGDRIVEYVRHALAQEPAYDALGISPFGNMFDPIEVPRAARRRIFEMAAETGCTSLSCESRPETMTDDDIAEAVKILGDRQLYVNVGLESAHPWIQANCVGKSLDLESYRESLDMLRRNGALPITNLLLGGPFLSEREAVASSVSSIRWALSQGTHLCVLFPSNVKGYTLQEWLWRRNRYRTPSLWSLVETVRQVGPEAAERVRLSWFAAAVSDPEEPAQLSDPVRAVPTTCPQCHRQVIEQLNAFNATGDFALIERLSASDCSCREAWRGTFEAQTGDLYDRVADGYQLIATGGLIDADWWRSHQTVVMDTLGHGYADGGFDATVTAAR